MPIGDSRLLYDTTTPFARYQVWDTVYGGRAARVLYSGERRTAQSGVAHDSRPDLLFDYNQRFMELLSAIQPARVLLIGGGVYTLPMAALAACPKMAIDVVEIDPGLDEIARHFFSLRPDPRLRIIHADGRDYLNNTDQLYDVVLIDAFVHASTPPELRSVEAIRAYNRHLTIPGLVARNLISPYIGDDAEPLHRQIGDYRDSFDDVSIFPAGNTIPLGISQNLVLTAQKGKPRPLDTYLRYPPLE
jgi:spermidine synthase